MTTGTFQDKLKRTTGPRRLLSLDGGGIRGIMSIEILAKMEEMLRTRERNDKLVLADYFDSIGGTSTGAIIATLLSLGKSTAEVRDFYVKSGEQMFDRVWLWKRHKYKYAGESLTNELQRILGVNATLGHGALRTLLMLMVRNATTDSPWPLSNNPAAKYNVRAREDCNLEIPLWKLVRASTAAPTYFPPEEVIVGKKRFVFVDGGVTVYNNPAFQLFLMATLEPYKLNWKAGEKDMLIVSVGTGSAAAENLALGPEGENLLGSARGAISGLMNAAAAQQDILCRSFGACRCGGVIDRELGDMIGVAAPGGTKLFTYVRYDPDVTRDGLNALGLTSIEPSDVDPMDKVENLGKMQDVGRAFARDHVRVEHFNDF